jgi:hypothetical protein
MCDKLVFDLAQEVEGSPSVFVRKDWINILDNQTSNYTSNQSVVDTSQLSNSNKYMSYRESYFIVPLTLTLASLGRGTVSQGCPNVNCTGAAMTAAMGGVMKPALNAPPVATDYGKALDSAIGLKNWFGNIIHSFTLDYNGSTIIQQTPFVNMWNSFKLMTSLSYNDVITQGSTIGFYPDDAQGTAFYLGTAITRAGSGGQNVAVDPLALQNAPAVAGDYASVINGNGVSNNNVSTGTFTNVATNYQSYNSGYLNKGLSERIKNITYDGDALSGYNLSGDLFSSLLSKANASQLWKSYIVKKQNQVANFAAFAPVAGTNALPTYPTFNQNVAGLLQIGVVATIYLKHVHSFFNMCPLLKGVFMKMTMNLNNSASTVVIGSNGNFPVAPQANINMSAAYEICTETSSALGGTNPIMLTGVNASNGCQNLVVKTIDSAAALAAAAASNIGISQAYRLSLSVGAVCLDAQTNNIAPGLVSTELGCKSIYLYIPAYTFNPPFEQAYIASPVKSIKYTDIYQYQVLGVSGGQAGGQFNNLLTNGIANIKSVLILPFFSTQGDLPIANVIPYMGDGTLNNVIGQNTGFIPGSPVWQSPFDPAGSGATSPLCHFTNFNVQVSGQNAIYNLQLRAFEQFNNQLYGQNAVNGGLTDGITSSLVDRLGFDLQYCYYYVNVERMLPVEQSVPKSVQVLGTNLSGKKVDLLCFIEYGTEVSIDVLTGSRV